MLDRSRFFVFALQIPQVHTIQTGLHSDCNGTSSDCYSKLI